MLHFACNGNDTVHNRLAGCGTSSTQKKALSKRDFGLNHLRSITIPEKNYGTTDRESTTYGRIRMFVFCLLVPGSSVRAPVELDNVQGWKVTRI